MAYALRSAGIAEPGIYTLPHAEYLADPVAVPSLNASVIKLLAEYSPAHARAAHPRFNAEMADDSSEAQDVGTAAHAIFLQGEDVVEFVDVPDWRTKAARAERDDIIAAGKLALKADRFEAVHRVVEVLERFREATGAFTEGKPEQTLVWEESGAWCRCKVDWLPDEPSAPLWDLKTVSGHATLREWGRSAYQFGADVQASWYPRGAEAVRGEQPADMYFAVVETTPPYGLGVFSFSAAALEVATAKVNYAVRHWVECMEADRWPGYSPERQIIEPPVWVLRDWEGQTATGRGLRLSPPRPAHDNLAARIIEAGSFG